MTIGRNLSELLSTFDFADRNSVVKLVAAYHEIDSNLIQTTYALAVYVLQNAAQALGQIKAVDAQTKELIEQSNEDVLLLEIASYLVNRALGMLANPEKAYEELVKLKGGDKSLNAAIVDLRNLDETEIKTKFDFLFDVKEAIEIIFSREAGYERLIVKSIMSAMYDLYQHQEDFALETLFTAMYVSIGRRVFDDSTAVHIQKTVTNRYLRLREGQSDDPTIHEPAYAAIDSILKQLDTEYMPIACNMYWLIQQAGIQQAGMGYH